ncbi:MAG: Opr family porin [Campylobacteraceae bacterium]|jgi:hypothetical protein|nr:Opr family porin [Campylobacteraceae bacterium]
MRIKISLISACLFASSALFADSTNIADALKNGKINGEFFIYAEQSDIKGADNEGFGSGSFNLGFTTDSLYGFKLDVGSRANHAFWEIDGGEYAQIDKAVLHTANIAYSHPHLDVILGRQEINLEWMEDFHEALVGVTRALPYTTITVGYTQRVAVADGDKPLRGFAEIGDIADNGAFVADIKYDGIEYLVLNPYVYYADDVALWAGAKAAYDGDFGEFKIGGTLQYVLSDEDNINDGSFLQAEARGTFAGVNAFLGFLKTDKDGGVGSIRAAGDNVNFFEDGDQIFEIDARTFYIGVNGAWNKFEFGGIFGSTEYAGGKMRELDLTIAYDLTEHFNLSAAFVNGNGEGDNDYNKIIAQAIYSF